MISLQRILRCVSNRVFDTHSRSDKDKRKSADQTVADIVRVLILGHGQKSQRLRYEERLGNCQGNYGQTRNHNTGNFKLEDPNGVEKQRGSSSALSHFRNRGQLS